MSEQQAKKLNLALYLNPVVSEADRVATNALQQWYEKTRKSFSDPSGSDLDSLVRQFHHDIYLAGLHLYLINPRLCRLVAEALAEDQHSVASLEKQLIACGLRISETKTEETAGFSVTQLEQLQELVARMPAPPAEPTAQAGQSVPQDSELTRQLAEQKEQLSAMMAELQQLRALAEQQARQLQQIGTGAQPASVARQPARSTSEEELNVSDMASQISQMQKIRKKGVF